MEHGVYTAGIRLTFTKKQSERIFDDHRSAQHRSTACTCNSGSGVCVKGKRPLAYGLAFFRRVMFSKSPFSGVF